MNITDFIKSQAAQAEQKEQNRIMIIESIISAGIADSRFDAEEIFEALAPVIDDFTTNARQFTDGTEIHLYSYEAYEEAFIASINHCHTSEYARGFEEVFYKIPADEQRRYLFWTHIAHSDYLFANNTTKVLSRKPEYAHYDRCLFWIAEIMD